MKTGTRKFLLIEGYQLNVEDMVELEYQHFEEASANDCMWSDTF